MKYQICDTGAASSISGAGDHPLYRRHQRLQPFPRPAAAPTTGTPRRRTAPPAPPDTLALRLVQEVDAHHGAGLELQGLEYQVRLRSRQVASHTTTAPSAPPKQRKSWPPPPRQVGQRGSRVPGGPPAHSPGRPAHSGPGRWSLSCPASCRCWRRPVRALNTVDLPTLGLPARPRCVIGPLTPSTRAVSAARAGWRCWSVPRGVPRYTPPGVHLQVAAHAGSSKSPDRGGTHCRTGHPGAGDQADVQQAAAHGRARPPIWLTRALWPTRRLFKKKDVIHIAGLLTYISLRKLCFRALLLPRPRKGAGGRKACVHVPGGKTGFLHPEGLSDAQSARPCGGDGGPWRMICRQAEADGCAQHRPAGGRGLNVRPILGLQDGVSAPRAGAGGAESTA